MPLHPMIAAMVEQRQTLGVPGLSDGTPDEARAMLAAGREALGAGPDMASTADVDIPGRSRPIPARILVPPGDVVGVIVYLHGGGWVVGAVDEFDTLGRTLAGATQCAVVLPDYRLAPEHPFPAGLEDAEDAITWVASGAVPGVASSLPLIVAGDSAGGNLVTVATRHLRDVVHPVLQVLIYPVTDSEFDTSSYQEHAEGLPLTRRDMTWFFTHYAPEDQWASPDISPSRAGDLAGLPSTLVLTAEHDVLRSDGERYAELLAAAGVPTTYRSYPDVTHGFVRMHNVLDVARDAIADIAGAVDTAVSAVRSAPI
ncbi:alpha/beta hydrolase [Aeromicrobium sp.]|uniref:alpha/beta hydrolase n=1 Tax=Aeromicrobium sp. TaxID=1871063 RepID=UPI0019CAAF53|nr:alpha/beta hydrolase [Aeromicrobium sp.]MBC7630378.1 alpha/beta hydrolase [Aeromicrobium sp.]